MTVHEGMGVMVITRTFITGFPRTLATLPLDLPYVQGTEL